ncbi:MAG: hypothetical protein NCW75_03155 [Phycisphaera sp.]|nr:MAG: hypothetical protein NCW75_03155 [Phycisphaera sp.]
MAATCGHAHAQVTPIGPFDGERNETFEGFPTGSFGTGETRRVLEDTADLGAGPDGRMVVDDYWGFICVLECCELFPFAGARSAGSSSEAGRYDFDEGIVRFGGYMGTNVFDADRPAPMAEFYDASGTLVGEDEIDLGGRCGRWAWNGWEFDRPVRHVILRGGVFNEAWIIMDNVRVDLGEGCRADLDGDGVLTIFDFLAYQNLFDAGDLAADFDGDGELTIFDFLAFQNEFDAGCE